MDKAIMMFCPLIRLADAIHLSLKGKAYARRASIYRTDILLKAQDLESLPLEGKVAATG